MPNSRSVSAMVLPLSLLPGLVFCGLSASAADPPTETAGTPVAAAATQNEPPPKRGAIAATPSESSSSEQGTSTSRQQVEQMVVTGTRLQLRKGEGVQEVDVYTREQIDQSGTASVNAFLSTLPDVSLSFTEGAAQSGSGQTTVKLHGLPAGTTLVLINGRRVQNSAITLGSSFASNFFDLNNVPLSAVERIEVLPEGASAVYGSDAIAGVVNIVLKGQFTGTEASVRYSHAENLPQWDASLGVGKQWARGGFTLLGSFQARDALSGFDRAVTATQDHTAEGGLDARLLNCSPPNIFGINGGNLPGLGQPYAAVPTGYIGVPSIAEFASTAGTLNRCSLYAYNSWVPETQREGVFAQGYLDLNDSVQLFAELLSSRVRQEFRYYPSVAFGGAAFQRFTVSASNPYNPFGTRVGITGLFLYAPVSYESEGRLVRPVFGLRGGFGSDWQWESALVYSRDHETYTSANSVIDIAAVQARFDSPDPALALNPFVDAPFDSPAFDSAVLHTYVQNYSASDLGVDAFARGTLFRAPSGPVRVVLGSEYHQYQLHTDNGNYASFQYGPPGVPATYSRNSYAVFAEGRIPIVAGAGGTQGLAALEGSLALRYDHFSDFGHTTNPQYGLEWRPVQKLLVRAAYGETFKAPPLFALYAPVLTTTPNFVRDPQRGNQLVPITLVTGGNVNLQPETGSTTSLGVVYAMQDLEASVTQWRIKEDGSIQRIPPQTLVNNPDAVPGAVIRDASGALTQVNAMLSNFGTIDVEGVSFQLAYKYRSPFGLWTPTFAATNTYRYQFALTPGGAATSAVSQAQNTGIWAPRWKGSLSLGWSNMSNVTINGAGRYVGAYRDYGSTQRIGDFWYFDLNAKYNFAKAFLELGGINIFDRQPQVSRYSSGFGGYDPAQADIRGRVLYLRLGGTF